MERIKVASFFPGTQCIILLILIQFSLTVTQLDLILVSDQISQLQLTTVSVFFGAFEQIERIQNPNLYQQYAVRKMHMEAANGASVQNEQLLWTVQHINNDGFNRSYCGKNGITTLSLSQFLSLRPNPNPCFE